jgi:hypothetical protein
MHGRLYDREDGVWGGSKWEEKGECEERRECKEKGECDKSGELGAVMSTILKRKHKHSDIKAYYQKKTKRFWCVPKITVERFYQSKIF